jgi:hypothetical protein
MFGNRILEVQCFGFTDQIGMKPSFANTGELNVRVLNRRPQKSYGKPSVIPLSKGSKEIQDTLLLPCIAYK